MSDPKKPRRGARLELALFVLLVILGLFICWWTMDGQAHLSREGIVRAGVGRDLLFGETRGRQGLIGSLEWAPLPTLLALPLLGLPQQFAVTWAFPIAAILAGALLCLFLSNWLRHCGVGTAPRIVIVLLVFLSPALQQPMLQGTSETLFILLTLISLCFLAHWWETEQLRSLAYLAISIALAMATRFQAVLLLAIASIFVAAHLVLRWKRRSYAEATLIIFLVPPLYVAGMWVIANWLIMGEPGFFLRGLPGHGATWNDWTALLTDGCDWSRAAYVVLIAFAAWIVGLMLRRQRTLWTAVPVICACLLLWTRGYAEIEFIQDPASQELTDIVSQLRMETADDWILMSGYRGYDVAQLLGEKSDTHLHHTLSFYREKVMSDTHGKRSYLLVPAPEGADRWEDINLKYPHIFADSAPFAVYERSWNHWRLLRIVRMDETDQR